MFGAMHAPGNIVVRFVLFLTMLVGFAAVSVWTVRLACADYWFLPTDYSGN